MPRLDSPSGSAETLRERKPYDAQRHARIGPVYYCLVQGSAPGLAFIEVVLSTGE